MVSLFEILLQSSGFSHISTSIPTLDSLMLGNITKGIYDFQSVPNCTAQYGIIISLLVSHLSFDEEHRAIIVDCLHEFPFLVLQKDPNFDPEWLESRITLYKCHTFAQLFSLFSSNKLKGPKNSTLLIVNNFHETVELYKYELSSAYKEAILKFQIHRNDILIRNQEKDMTEGSKTPIQELPSSSDLVRVPPSHKFQTHLTALVNLISQLIYRDEMVCILVGYLDLQYEYYKPKSALSSMEISQPSSSKSSSPPRSAGGLSGDTGARAGRLTFAPSFGDTYTTAKSNSKFKGKIPILDSFTTTRLIFLKDWFHNTPYFQKYLNKFPGKKLELSELRTVFLVKVVNTQVPGSLSPFVYFDYDNEFYEDFKINKPKYDYCKFIDLSAPVDLNTPLAPHSFNFGNKNLKSSEPIDFSTQNESNATLINDSTYQKVLPPSSPNLTESQIRDFLHNEDNPEDKLSTQKSPKLHSRHSSSDSLVIQPSDEEFLSPLA